MCLDLVLHKSSTSKVDVFDDVSHIPADELIIGAIEAAFHQIVSHSCSRNSFYNMLTTNILQKNTKQVKRNKEI